MGRGPRIHFAGAFYHVMARGFIYLIVSIERKTSAVWKRDLQKGTLGPWKWLYPWLKSLSPTNFKPLRGLVACYFAFSLRQIFRKRNNSVDLVHSVPQNPSSWSPNPEELVKLVNPVPFSSLRNWPIRSGKGRGCIRRILGGCIVEMGREERSFIRDLFRCFV